MSSDLRRLSLIDLPSTRTAVPAEITVNPVRPEDATELAALYLDGYPPGTGAADLAEAAAEIAATFVGEFGVLRSDASLIARADGVAVGAILVTERSIWDAHLDGPYVIDFFVSPEARRRGVGTALLAQAVERCRGSGSVALSLRVGSGTSDAAHRLYARFGFVDPADEDRLD